MKAYHLFKELIRFLCSTQLLSYISINNNIKHPFRCSKKNDQKTDAGLNDHNIGGQLIPVAEAIT